METSSSRVGISFPGLLTCIFITLKLLGKITWSWWWVLSPLLIVIGLVVIFMICLGLWVFRA